MKKYSMLPLVGDLWDRSAAKNPKTATALDTLKVLVPAGLACANSLSEAIAKFLGQGPVGSVITTTAPSLLLALASGYVISKKVPMKSALADGTSSNAEPFSYPTYVYPQGIRVAAKVVLLPLIILFSISAKPILPNILVGQQEIGGFVCDATDGLPIDRGQIRVLSHFGNEVTSGPIELDSIGFFHTSLKPWAMTAAQLELTRPTCRAEIIGLRSLERGKRVCPGSPMEVYGQPGEWRMWLVSCSKEK